MLCGVKCNGSQVPRFHRVSVCVGLGTNGTKGHVASLQGSDNRRWSVDVETRLAAHLPEPTAIHLILRHSRFSEKLLMQIHHLNCISSCPLGGALMDGCTHGLRGRPACHCLLVEAPNCLVLVETGFGLRDVADPPSRLSRFFLDLALSPEFPSGSRHALKCGHKADARKEAEGRRLLSRCAGRVNWLSSRRS